MLHLLFDGLKIFSWLSNSRAIEARQFPHRRKPDAGWKSKEWLSVAIAFSTWQIAEGLLLSTAESSSPRGARAMANETSIPKKSDPIVIEAAGMRIWVDYRRGIGGDEGLTFDITVAGEKDGARILRFDCFSKTPHYHVGASAKNPVHDMNAEGISDPVRWTLNQLKTRLPAMVAEAGYDDIAKSIDQQAIAQSLSQAEKDIFAKI
jgi:hypothetical protein